MENEKIGADKRQKLVEKVEKRKKRIGTGSGEMEKGWGKGRKKEKGEDKYLEGHLRIMRQDV